MIRSFSERPTDEIGAFFYDLQRLPKEERKDFYDEHLDVARSYLTKLGVNPVYYELVAVNEIIRMAILEYITKGDIFSFDDDGIYFGVENEKRRVFGIVKREEIDRLARGLSTHDISRHVVNFDLVKSINQLLNSDLEVDPKTDKGAVYIGFTKREFVMSGDLLFLNGTTFITVALDKKEKEKEEERQKKEEERLKKEREKKKEKKKTEVSIAEDKTVEEKTAATVTEDKKGEEKTETTDSKAIKVTKRTAMIKLDTYGKSCHIKLVNEKGIVSYEEKTQAFGGNIFINWLQKFYWFRHYDSKGKSVVEKVEISIFRAKKKTVNKTFADDGDPISLNSKSWRYKKNHLLTYFEKYPKYKEWFYERFKNPIALLDLIYGEQEEEFQRDVDHFKSSIKKAKEKKVSLQEQLDHMVGDVLGRIVEPEVSQDIDSSASAIGRMMAVVKKQNYESIREEQLEDFDRIVNQELQKIPSWSTQNKVLDLLQLSINKAYGEKIGEREEENEEEIKESSTDTSVGVEAREFENSRTEYYEKSQQKYKDVPSKVEALIGVLYRRHKLMRTISLMTPKTSSYDEELALWEGQIEVLEKAVEIMAVVANSRYFKNQQAGATKRNVSLNAKLGAFLTDRFFGEE